MPKMDSFYIADIIADACGDVGGGPNSRRPRAPRDTLAFPRHPAGGPFFFGINRCGDEGQGMAVSSGWLLLGQFRLSMSIPREWLSAERGIRGRNGG